MTNIKIGNRELSVKYGYKAVATSKIIKKLVALDKDFKDNEVLDQIDVVMGFLPELFLIGLQTYHKDEFGFDYITGKGKEEALDKVYTLLDDYFDSEEADFNTFFNMLQNEMLENGFLAKMLKKEMEKK